MTCEYHNSPDPCPICNGMDTYIPTTMSKDIESHGALFWWKYAGFWMRLYFEAEGQMRALRKKKRASMPHVEEGLCNSKK